MSDQYPFSPENRSLIERVATVGFSKVILTPEAVDGNTTLALRCADLNELLDAAREQERQKCDPESPERLAVYWQLGVEAASYPNDPGIPAGANEAQARAWESGFCSVRPRP